MEEEGGREGASAIDTGREGGREGGNMLLLEQL